ncbi:MAG: response regulator [Bacteroidia bacterium]
MISKIEHGDLSEYKTLISFPPEQIVYHKLLARQVKRCLSTEEIQQPHIQKFLEMVNESYLGFEKDRALMDHAFSISEKEYIKVNEQLRSEIDQRKQSIQKLKEALLSLDNHANLHENWEEDNLLIIAEYLKAQIDAKKEAIADKNVALNIARSKAEFLSMMSHEIRTPLNGVVGIANLLSKESLTKAQMQNVKILQFSADHLLSLINDILDYSKIESGRIELEETEFDLHLMMENIKSANQMKAEDNGTKLRLLLDSDLPKILKGDVTRISQILHNLTSNAIKFTKNGHVLMEVSVHSESLDTTDIYFSVKDTGIGIAKNKQKAIFEQFTQASGDIARRFGGTGLGLAISLKLVEMMNSNIELESEEGQGSHFYFTLSLKKVREPKQMQLPSVENKANKLDNLKGIHILVAEDNEINQLIISQFLKKWEASFEVVADGLEAVEQARKKQFDVVLMDIQMPNMDGYDATELIRSFNQKVPIIALTASAMLEMRDRAFDIGMTDFVTKPFNPNELLGKIKKHTQPEQVIMDKV